MWFKCVLCCSGLVLCTLHIFSHTTFTFYGIIISLPLVVRGGRGCLSVCVYVYNCVCMSALGVCVFISVNEYSVSTSKSDFLTTSSE